jgi:hypothetical protein
MYQIHLAAEATSIGARKRGAVLWFGSIQTVATSPEGRCLTDFNQESHNSPPEEAGSGEKVRRSSVASIASFTEERAGFGTRAER